MTRSKYILWIDTETSGSDSTSTIYELGMILTDRQLNPVAEKVFLCNQGIRDMRLVDFDPIVLEMHVKNGLFQELLGPIGIERRVSRHQDLDREAAQWLIDHTKNEDSLPIPYAGSGVGHFDIHLIRQQLPLLTGRLTYWPYDVGVLRRFIKLSGHPELVPPSGKWDDKPHRALADARLHLDEAAHYLNLLHDRLGGDPE